MGKLMNQYVAEYEAAVNASMRASGWTDGYIVLPEVWIAAKWTLDNNTAPWEAGFKAAVEDLRKDDPELAAAVVSGTQIMTEAVFNGERETPLA